VHGLPHSRHKRYQIAMLFDTRSVPSQLCGSCGFGKASALMCELLLGGRSCACALSAGTWGTSGVSFVQRVVLIMLGRRTRVQLVRRPGVPTPPRALLLYLVEAEQKRPSKSPVTVR
jgi:hypothetical protein